MIEFHDVWKAFPYKGGTKQIVTGLTLAFPKDRSIAIIGRNGAGKSTLLSMIAGTIDPDRGEIVKLGRTSWPMGFRGGFHGDLTGRQNTRFVARIYGTNTEEMEAYVEEFAELGRFLDMPVRTYSSGMKARLAFGVSLAARFDCYLVDEITGVGDSRFRAKCRRAFKERVATSQIIMVSHSDNTLRSYCESALLLENGTATFFDDLEEALEIYGQVMAH
ncbi:ABC transporter ATP-binding protein [Pseudoruegeria sp. HB172150]|uniref:ABC transporter ATP-binding protein n=1 Tax=Pseudoruegeria sp. HB172150 TaxID=2721164 RepID=UPI001555F6FF|nr:ABC transporter ATP-binding protein [Pseudoruegeria sp. HB172150]